MDTEYIGLRITGLKPADVRAGELGSLISSFEEMIASTVKRNRPQISKEDLGVGLVKIEDKSVGLEFATKLPELTFPAYTIITEAIAHDSLLSLSGATLKALREIHAFIKTKNCDCEMTSRNGQVTLQAVLRAKTEIPEHPRLKTETVIYGRIMRVGGVEPRVTVEQSKGKTLFCPVKNEALARQIAERLYTWAGLGGVATLDSDSLEVLEFRVNSLGPYQRDVSLKDAIAELAAVIGPYYTNIHDVEQYVSDLRH